jgi:hypothetical protein
MNDTASELELIRSQLRAAIERDLHDRSRRSRVTRRRSFRVAVPTLAVLSAAAAAIVLGLIVSGASPSSASAAAQKALAATAAAPSGTMTTSMLHAGVTRTVDAARWNGSDIAFSPTGFAAIPQLLLIGGGMYVQTSDGTWLHYANASNVGPKPLGGLMQLAQDNIAATTAQQILALATGVQKTAQPDGSTLYTGTIPNSSINPSNDLNDAITSMILSAQKRTDMMIGAGKGNISGGQQSDLQLQMSVGGDGLVRQVSVTFQQAGTGSRAMDGTYTWSVTYSQLGSTPSITPPASSTDVPPATLPPGTRPSENGGQAPKQTITPADQADYAKAASCMRSHGVPDFPDPTFENNTVTFNVPPNIDPNSPQAKTAEAICVNLIPPGLPYSNRGAR